MTQILAGNLLYADIDNFKTGPSATHAVPSMWLIRSSEPLTPAIQLALETHLFADLRKYELLEKNPVVEDLDTGGWEGVDLVVRGPHKDDWLMVCTALAESSFILPLSRKTILVDQSSV